MAETLKHLCSYIIRDDFGPVVEQVAKALLEKGRLTLQSISTHSKLTISKTRECIFVLIQHNLVYWAESREGEKIFVYYSIEKNEIISRLNFGIYLKNANEWVGHRCSRKIVEQISLMGKTTFSSFIEELKLSKRTNQYKEYKACFIKMIEERYLSPVQFTDSKSAQDKASEAEEKELAKMTNFIPTKKQMSQENKSADNTLDENQYYRLNYEKLNVKLRNMRIELFVKIRVNSFASLITKILLDIANEHRLNEVESRPISLQRIHKSFPVEKLDSMCQHMKIDRQKSTNRELVIKQHLDYLVENEINLLKRKGDDDSDDDSGNSTGIGISGGMYYIQYQKVMETIKQELFEDIISKKYDHTGTRVVRLLHMKDKLEEKAIATFTLMTASDVRRKLTDLLNVPKSADRSPSRTFFLWYVDYQHCYRQILDNYYCTLANIHRIRFDNEESSARLLEKQEKEETLKQLNPNTHHIQLLNDYERKELHDLELVLTQFDTAQLRIVKDIMLFRDYK
ncbi:8681_t:CDS:10 [Entrophospora sp. SA101]|nr:8681_t:CDS:10 [Entrophospora sp. SA101]